MATVRVRRPGDAVRQVRTAAGVVATVDGPPGGPSVVLVPSLGTNADLYRGLATRLNEGGHRTIAIDLRGHGRSVLADPFRRVADLAGDIDACLDQVPVARAIVLGCSVGAMAAAHFAVANPERCAGLVLTGAAPSFGPPSLWDARMATVASEGTAALAAGATDRWLTTETIEGPNSPVEELRASIGGLSSTAFLAYASALRDTDIGDLLPRITSPTLIITGAEDRAAPVEQAERLHRDIPTSALAILEGAAHLAHLDRPDAFETEVMCFLGSNAVA